MQGTRVNSISEVLNGEAGVYFPVIEGTIVKGLWFRLPTGNLGRIAAKGYGADDEPEWDICVNPDDTVTVNPSIEQQAIESADIPYWHGHLRSGVWEG